MPYRGICTSWKSEGLIHSHTFVIVFSREPGLSRASLLCTLNPLSSIWNAFSDECGSLVQIEKCVKSWSLITSHLTSNWICVLVLSVHSLTLQGSWIIKIFSPKSCRAILKTSRLIIFQDVRMTVRLITFQAFSFWSGHPFPYVAYGLPDRHVKSIQWICKTLHLGIHTYAVVCFKVQFVVSLSHFTYY